MFDGLAWVRRWIALSRLDTRDLKVDEELWCLDSQITSNGT